MKNFVFTLLVGLVSLSAIAQSNAPSNLAGTAPAYNQVVLTWKDNSTNETKFEIELQGLTGSFSKIGEVGANITTYTDNTVQANGSYTYRVRAVLSTGATTTYSNTVTVTTPQQPPGIPTSVNAVAQGSNSIQVTWTNASSGGSPTDYLVERGTASSGPFTQIATVAYSRTPSLTDNGVTGGQQYCYRIRARNAGGTSNYSSVACATLPLAPSNVKNFKVTAISSSSIKLTWTGYGKETNIGVERRTGQTGSWSQIATTLADGGEYTDNNLSASTEYCYRISESGHDYSAIACATTSAPPAVPPVTPTGLSVLVVSDTQLQIFWQDANVVPVTFDLERANKTGGTYTVIATNLTSKIYDDKGLTASTQYCYRVRAKNNAGLYSTYSNEACGTTKAPPATIPDAPARLTVSAVSSSQINLQWADLSDNETGFQVERATGGPTATFTKIADVGANVTTYNDPNLQGSTQYCYRVRAVNAVGTSGYTDVQCATTPAPPVGVPQNLAASASSTTQINLTWTSVASANGYQLERSPDGNNWTKIADPTANATSYADNGLTPNTKYYYRLRALNATGAPGGYSNIANATTPDAPPTAPARLSVTSVTYSQVSLQWADLSSNESGFQVERSPDGNAWTKITDVGANVTTYNDQSVVAQTHYYYRVRAVNAAGASGYTNVVDTTTPVGPPAAPQNLVATAASTTQINLTWTAVANATTILIERSPNGNDSWNQMASVAGTATSYNDPNLTPNTHYYYRIRATNATGNGQYSNVADAITPDAPPTSPARLTITATAYNQVSLQWADLSNNETSFQLERSPDGAAWTKIADVGANVTTYNDQSVLAQTHYYYRVRAVNAAGASGYTNVVDTTTPVGPPTAPQNLAATAASTTQINLTWTAVANATTILIERSPNGNDSWNQMASVAGTATSYNDPNLTPNTHYYYRIRATNATGNGPYSNVADATTPDAPPVAPARLTATVASFSQINLQWADLSNNESGFEIELSTDGTTFKKIADVGPNVTTYNSTNLNPRTHYYYRVRAVNAAGPSPYSNVADATTPESPPVAPARLTATPASATSITLAWTDASDNETGFEIQRSLDGSTWSKIADVPANTTTYTDNGLSVNTKYYYRVRAVNAVGVSAFSTTADATTPDVPPAAPARLTATAISSSQINLQWADLSTNESGFEVERSSSAMGTFQKVADLPANATTYEDKNLTDNTLYCYRVRAKNAAGPSGYTDPACVSTPLAPPAAPTNLTAQVFDYDQIRLNWSPVGSSAVTVYIERSTSPTSGFTEIKQQPVGPVTYIDMGLQAFTTYYYRIRVSNAAGYSGYSNVATSRVEEVVIAVEDELETHTTLFVNQRTLHVITNWFSTMSTTVQLLTFGGQPVVLDHRKVNPSDCWSYNLDTLPAGLYVLSIVADGRKLAKRLLLP